MMGNLEEGQSLIKDFRVSMLVPNPDHPMQEEEKEERAGWMFCWEMYRRIMYIFHTVHFIIRQKRIKKGEYIMRQIAVTFYFFAFLFL